MSATVTLVAQGGEEIEVPLKIARGSKFIRDVVSQCPDSLDPIPLPAIAERELRLIIEYLGKHCMEPIKFLRRPLPKAELESTQAPLWAVDFINSVRLGSELVDLMEAASSLGIEMLSQLASARVAALIMKLPREEIEQLRDRKEEDQKKLTYAEEKLLKEQNRWAWESEITDVVADPEDLLECE